MKRSSFAKKKLGCILLARFWSFTLAAHQERQVRLDSRADASAEMKPRDKCKMQTKNNPPKKKGKKKEHQLLSSLPHSSLQHIRSPTQI